MFGKLVFLVLIGVVLGQDVLTIEKARQRNFKKYRVPEVENGKKKPCKDNEFSCLNGNCIPLSGYCNFEKQCDDNSDELDCVWPKCDEKEEFTCANGECINKTLYNNFVYDCTDKSDEDKKICNGFQCNDGQCIPNHLKCDGEIDCAGAYREDERDCPKQELKEPHKECKNGHKYLVEDKCQYTTRLGYMESCRDATHLEDCQDYKCPATMHKCPKSYCIPYEVRCDDIKDCPHGEDEFDCERKDDGHVTDLQP